MVDEPDLPKTSSPELLQDHVMVHLFPSCFIPGALQHWGLDRLLVHAAHSPHQPHWLSLFSRAQFVWRLVAVIHRKWLQSPRSSRGHAQCVTRNCVLGLCPAWKGLHRNFVLDLRLWTHDPGVFHLLYSQRVVILIDFRSIGRTDDERTLCFARRF